MNRVEIIKHSDLDQTKLIEICKIKSVAWKYDLESQKKWIQNNLLKDDLHFLNYVEGKLVSYLNLVEVFVVINGNSEKALGVGNVCALVQGKGYGISLINFCNNYIVKSEKIGILFCQPALLDFYAKTGWTQVSKSKITFNRREIDFETMIYDFNNLIGQVAYSDRLF